MDRLYVWKKADGAILSTIEHNISGAEVDQRLMQIGGCCSHCRNIGLNGI